MIVLRRSTLAPIALVALMAAAGCGRKETVDVAQLFL